VLGNEEIPVSILELPNGILPFRPNMNPPKFTTRTVLVGGKSKEQLRQELDLHGIRMNQAAEDLFANPAFKTSEQCRPLECVEASLAELGFASGATFAALSRRITELGLLLCPLETGPHLRLRYRDQPEGFAGNPPTKHRAPPGSLTIASAPLDELDATPKGFYLRKIDGELWLRGYWSGPDHIWAPDDRLVFHRESASG